MRIHIDGEIGGDPGLPHERLAPGHVLHEAQEAGDGLVHLGIGAAGHRCAAGARPRDLALHMGANEAELLLHALGCLMLAGLLQVPHLGAENRQRCLQAVRQCAGPVARLAHEVFLAVEQFVDVLDQRRDLVRKAPGHAPDLAGLYRIQIATDLLQRTQAQRELNPGEKNQDGGDRNEHAGHVPTESLAQFHHLRVVERDREADRPGPLIAIDRDLPFDHVEFRAVGSLHLEGPLALRALPRPGR